MAFDCKTCGACCCNTQNNIAYGNRDYIEIDRSQKLYREERALLARLDRLERERSLLPRDEVRVTLGRICAFIRGAGETLQRRIGRDAVEILYEALDDAERDIARYFGDEPTHANDTPDTK